MGEEQFEIEIDYDHFSTDGESFKEGDRFIGLSINSNKSRGMGSPCKSREEVIEGIRNYIFNDGYENGEKLNTTEKDVVLINKTDLDITKGDIFKQSLKKWF